MSNAEAGTDDEWAKYRGAMEAIAHWRSSGLLSHELAERLAAALDPPDPPRAGQEESVASSEKKPNSYLHVDVALLVLSAFLNGAAFFAIGVWTGMEDAWPVLIGMWIFSLVPLVYVARLRIITALMVALLYVWLFTMTIGDLSGAELLLRWRSVLSICIAGSMALFAVGGLHYLARHLHPLARTYRLAGLSMAALATYALTFRAFGQGTGPVTALFTSGATRHLGTLTWSLVVAALVSSAINHRYHERFAGVWRGELILVGALCGIAVVHVMVPMSASFFVAAFNVVFAAGAIAASVVGITRSDQALFAIGGVALGMLVVGRGFDFWGASLPVATVSVLSIAVLAVIALIYRTVWTARASPSVTSGA